MATDGLLLRVTETGSEKSTREFQFNRFTLTHLHPHDPFFRFYAITFVLPPPGSSEM